MQANLEVMDLPDGDDQTMEGAFIFLGWRHGISGTAGISSVFNALVDRRARDGSFFTC